MLLLEVALLQTFKLRFSRMLTVVALTGVIAAKSYWFKRPSQGFVILSKAWGILIFMFSSCQGNKSIVGCQGFWMLHQISLIGSHYLQLRKFIHSHTEPRWLPLEIHACSIHNLGLVLNSYLTLNLVRVTVILIEYFVLNCAFSVALGRHWLTSILYLFDKYWRFLVSCIIISFSVEGLFVLGREVSRNVARPYTFTLHIPFCSCLTNFVFNVLRLLIPKGIVFEQPLLFTFTCLLE